MTFHDYATIESRLNDTDIYALIAECDAILAENPTEFIRLLRSALSLSAHVLEHDKSALASQLAGRLYHHYETNADVRAFVDSITPLKNSLFPIRNGYDPLTPAGALRFLSQEMSRDDNYLHLTDGHIVIWRDDAVWLCEADSTPITPLQSYKSQNIKSFMLKDGRSLSWGKDKPLSLLDADGNLLAILDGHLASVNGVLELRDGRILSWSTDNTLRLWDKNGNSITTLMGHVNSVTGALELTNGYLLSWGWDGTAQLWDNEGMRLAILAHTGWVLGAFELTDGRILSWDSQHIRLSELSGSPIRQLSKHSAIIKGILALKSGRVVSWGFDKKLYVWDKNGFVRMELQGHTENIMGVLEVDNRRILAWGYDNGLRLWDGDGHLVDTYTLTPVVDLEHLQAWLNQHALAFNPHDIYSPEYQEDYRLMTDNRVKYNKTELLVYAPKTDNLLHIFYGDAPFTSVDMLDDVVIAGDIFGRVLFLRWVE